MPQETLHNLAEHTAALVALLGLASGAAAFLFYRLVNGMDKKIDVLTKALLDLTKGCAGRIADCNETYVGRGEFTEWKQGRDGPGGLWHSLNHHAHDDKGRVTKT
jgi:hypothetical protein